MRHVAPSGKATPGLTLVNQAIPWKSPHHSLLCTSIKSAHFVDQFGLVNLMISIGHWGSTELTGLNPFPLVSLGLRTGPKDLFRLIAPPSPLDVMQCAQLWAYLTQPISFIFCFFWFITSFIYFKLFFYIHISTCKKNMVRYYC